MISKSGMEWMKGLFPRLKKCWMTCINARLIWLIPYYVINVGGYIGESTKSEIEYAKAHGKEVRYLEE